MSGNLTGIKITQLNDIGANISPTSLIPIVDTTNIANPITDKANLQIVGNLILSGAGGANFSPANVALISLSVANAAQPNITSVGNLTGLRIVDVSTLNIPGGYNGYFLQTDGSGNLSWVSTASQNIIYDGNSNVSIPTTDGNVYINANNGSDQQWTFDNNGQLTLPNGSGITGQPNTAINIYTNSGVYSGIQLNDNGTNSNVLLYSQEGAYNWIFEDNGNLTVPGSSYIKPVTGSLNLTDASGNSYIDIDTNNIYFYTDYEGSEYEWNLDSTGNTTFPSVGTANLGNLVTANYANFANDLVVQGNISNANNISVTNNITADTANVTGNLVAGNVDGGNLVKANNFSTNGSGGNVTLTGGNIIGAKVISSSISITIPVAVANLPSATTAGQRAFVNNANLVAAGNFGATVGAGGSNIVPVYSDGSNWRIG